jgi:Fic family protein
MRVYIHELRDWPRFRFDMAAIAEPLVEVRHQQGLLMGKLEGLGFHLRDQADLETVTSDVLKSSEIEGEKLDLTQVRSSIARRLGIDIAGTDTRDRHVEGIVEMMLDATRGYDRPLTAERLFAWHGALFPTGRSGMRTIQVAAWRTEPMEVVSGPIGREKVHFEAPAAARLDEEMRGFTEWFNAPPSGDPVLRAALAHLWFLTVHPFDDGNGRIARAIADMALSRSEHSPRRFYSMSTEIRARRREYYTLLESTQRGSLDVTLWIRWFLDCMRASIAAAHHTLAGIMAKGRFWETHAGRSFNPRQRQMLNKLLDGFEGKLTTSKWAAITGASPDSALRDILDLIEHGALARDGAAGGRSTGYRIVIPDPAP